MTSVETPRVSDRETEEAGLHAEAAEREAFEARFPPETFSRIAEAMGLPPEPEILSGLRRSLLETFYFLYAISSGESLSRKERISGLTELRDAARSLSKALRYSGAWIAVGSLGKVEDEPMYDEKFRATVRSLAAKAEKKIVELKSRRDQPGRPKKEDFWELMPDLVRVYEGWTGNEAKTPPHIRGRKVGGFRSFVVAVNGCLRANLTEVTDKLPSGPSAVRSELRKRGY
jgi:hypothetical protein